VLERDPRRVAGCAHGVRRPPEGSDADRLTFAARSVRLS